MKKTILAMLFSLVYVLGIAQQDWSIYLERAHKEADYSQTFFEIMSEHKNESSTATGYFALSNMMLAKKYTNPFVKLKYFNIGRELLDEIIIKDSANVELRFLRFAVQSEVPAILFYFNNKEMDKKIIDTYIAHNQDGLTERIQKYYNLKSI